MKKILKDNIRDAKLYIKDRDINKYNLLNSLNLINYTNKLLEKDNDPTHIPQLLKYYTPSFVNPNEDIIQELFVTDFNHKHYKTNNEFREEFTVRVWIDGVLQPETKVVKSGDFKINIGKLPEGVHNMQYDAIDSIGRISPRIFTTVKVQTPIEDTLTNTDIFSPTAEELNTEYGIFNDNTNYESTTSGFNNLFEYFKNSDYKKIILPAGVYRLYYPENTSYTAISINELENKIIDFNNVEFTLEASSGDGIMIHTINCYNCIFKNIKLIGDLDERLSKKLVMTEFAHGFAVKGCQNCKFENFTITKMVGYGLIMGEGKYNEKYHEGSSNGLPPRREGCWINDVIKGSINTETGEYQNDPNCVCSSDFITLFKTFSTSKNDWDLVTNHKLALGKWGYGKGNLPGNESNAFRLSLYDENKNYIETITAHNYTTIDFNKDTRYVKVTLFTNSPLNVDVGQTQMADVKKILNCEFKNITLEHIRCVGITLTVVDNVLFDNVSFYHCGWKMANCAWDAEDGWQAMQNVTVRHFNFIKGDGTTGNYGTETGNKFLNCSGFNFIAEDNDNFGAFQYPACKSFRYRRNNFGYFHEVRTGRDYHETFNNIFRDGVALKYANIEDLIVTNSRFSGSVSAASNENGCRSIIIDSSFIYDYDNENDKYITVGGINNVDIYNSLFYNQNGYLNACDFRRCNFFGHTSMRLNNIDAPKQDNIHDNDYRIYFSECIFDENTYIGGNEARFDDCVFNGVSFDNASYLELNRCRIKSMSDKPLFKNTNGQPIVRIEIKDSVIEDFNNQFMFDCQNNDIVVTFTRCIIKKPNRPTDINNKTFNGLFKAYYGLDKNNNSFIFNDCVIEDDFIQEREGLTSFKININVNNDSNALNYDEDTSYKVLKEVPIFNVKYYDPVLYSGDELILPYYVTDYEQQEYLDFKAGKIFYVEFSIDGVKVASDYVTAGEHKISLGHITELGVHEIEITTVDVETKISAFKQILQVYCKERKEPVIYTMTESDLTTYNLTNVDTSDETLMTKNIDGLNQIITEKKNGGYDVLKLYPGQYNVNPRNTRDRAICVPTQFTLDLNGSKIKHKYTGTGAASLIMKIDTSAIDSHIINGKIEGDYDEHDVTVVGPESAAGSGIEGEGYNSVSMGGAFCSLEDVEVSWVTGYSICSGGFTSCLSKTYPYGKNYTNTMITKTGEEIDSEDLITTEYCDISNIVNSGFPYILFNVYLAYGGIYGYTDNTFISFYDKDKKFISRVKSCQYKLCKIPENSYYARATLYYDKEKITDIYNAPRFHGIKYLPTSYSKIRNVYSHDTRTVAMATGMFNHLLVEDCKFERCGYRVTPGPIDIEDGSYYSSNYYFFNNTVSERVGTFDIIFTHGSNIWMENTNFSPYARGCNSLHLKNLICDAGVQITKTDFRHKYHRILDSSFKSGISFMNNGVNTKDITMKELVYNCIVNSVSSSSKITILDRCTNDNKLYCGGNATIRNSTYNLIKNPNVTNSDIFPNMYFENTRIVNNDESEYYTFRCNNSKFINCIIGNKVTFSTSIAGTGIIFNKCYMTNTRYQSWYWTAGSTTKIEQCIINNPTSSHFYHIAHYSMDYGHIVINSDIIMGNPTDGIIWFFDDREYKIDGYSLEPFIFANNRVTTNNSNSILFKGLKGASALNPLYINHYNNLIDCKLFDTETSYINDKYKITDYDEYLI